jgi:hypothetical protein
LNDGRPDSTATTPPSNRGFIGQCAAGLFRPQPAGRAGDVGRNRGCERAKHHGTDGTQVERYGAPLYTRRKSVSRECCRKVRSLERFHETGPQLPIWRHGAPWAPLPRFGRHPGHYSHSEVFLS